MKFQILAIIQFLFLSATGQTLTSAQLDSIATEDEIIQQVEFGTPSSPLLRFGTEYVSLFGKWSYEHIDSVTWIFSEAEPTSLVSGSGTIDFHFYGKANLYFNTHAFIILTERLVGYEIDDSVLTLLFESTTDQQIRKDHFVIAEKVGTQLLIRRIEIPLTQKINIGDEPITTGTEEIYVEPKRNRKSKKEK